MKQKAIYAAFLALIGAAASLPCFPARSEAQEKEKGEVPESKDLLGELKNYPHKLVYESNRDGNFKLYLCNADGSGTVALTKSADVDELYPKPSPDGTRICFVCDEVNKDGQKVRNVYYMNSDGTGRVKIASNGREPCWSPDGTKIAYLGGLFEKFTYSDFATRGLFIYDLKTGKTTEHVNKKLEHLYTLNWAPDGKWFMATVHGGGLGFGHAILAIEADGTNVYNLKLSGCRPNISPDGKKVTWGNGDYCAGLAELDFTGEQPKATFVADMVTSKNPVETYHVTWSPDMKYITFSRGPRLKGKNAIKGLLAEFPGVNAPDWNICVALADPKNRDRWVRITTDGKSCKQPSWVVVASGPRVQPGRKE